MIVFGQMSRNRSFPFWLALSRDDVSYTFPSPIWIGCFNFSNWQVNCPRRFKSDVNPRKCQQEKIMKNESLTLQPCLLRDRLTALLRTHSRNFVRLPGTVPLAQWTIQPGNIPRSSSLCTSHSVTTKLSRIAVAFSKFQFRRNRAAVICRARDEISLNDSYRLPGRK